MMMTIKDLTSHICFPPSVFNCKLFLFPLCAQTNQKKNPDVEQASICNLAVITCPYTFPFTLDRQGNHRFEAKKSRSRVMPVALEFTASVKNHSKSRGKKKNAGSSRT